MHYTANVLRENQLANCIDLPGATHMGFMKELAESHPWEKLYPSGADYQRKSLKMKDIR
jgi:hypothetical protein